MTTSATTEEVKLAPDSSGPKNPLDVLPAERYNLKIDLPSPLLQKHLEDFQMGLHKRIAGEDLPVSVIRGFTVRTAIELGWLTGLPIEDVSALEATKVAWAYAVIAYHIGKAQEVDPN